MGSSTTNLGLYKADPIVDKNDTFNIDTMLNQNWDKIDVAHKSTDTNIGNLPTLKTTTKSNLVGSVNEVYDRLETEAYSTPTEVTASVFSLPENTVNGQVSELVVKGNTVTNIVINGGFAEGTSGWSTNNTTFFGVVSNNLTAITDATAFRRAIVQRVFVPAGTVLYFRFKVEKNNTVIAVLRENIASGIIDFQTPSLSAGIDYVSFKVTTTVNNPFFYIANSIAEATEIKIDGKYGFTIIDLTSAGLSSLTKEECDKRFSYIVGTKSTNSVRVKGINKNKFHYKNLTKIGNPEIVDGYYKCNRDNFYRTNGFKVLGAQSYVYSFEAYRTTSGSRPVGYARYFDKGGNLILEGYLPSALITTTPTQLAVVISTPPNAEEVHIDIARDSVIDNFVFQRKHQLELKFALPSTPYEPYQESISYIDTELSSVRNSFRTIVAQDKTNEKGQLEKYTKTLTNVASGTTVNYADMGATGWFNAYFADGTSQVAQKGAVLTATAVTLIYQLANPIVIYIPITPLQSFPNGSVVVEPYLSRKITTATTTITLPYSILSIDKLRKLNGTVWETATGTLSADGLSITGVTAGTFLVEGLIRSENSTLPSITFSVPLNRAAQTDDNTNMINIHSKLLRELILASL